MKVSIATIAGLFFLASGVLADPNADYGKTEYESNCASCHGLKGKGDGPLSQIYLTKPTDLTTLAKRNGGVFPAQRVHEIIDGRQEVEAHGPRTMPVWGREYRTKVPDLPPQLGFPPQLGLGYTDYRYRNRIAHAKIAMLVDYLYRLQEK